jgi:tetratricopeptide (TPR) repeat protein
MKLCIWVLLLLVSPSYGQQIARWTNPKVSVTFNHPPALGLNIQRIAFKAGPDQDSQAFVGSLTEDFVNGGMEVIERQRIEDILSELDFGASGYLDSNTATQIGNILGPSALVFVNVHSQATEHSRSHKVTKTKKGSYTTYYAKTSAFFKASVQVVDLSTARIFSAKTVEHSSHSQNQSGDGYPEYPSAYSVLNLAIQDGRQEVRRMFFSWTEVRKLVFFNDKRCNLKEAHQYLKIGDIDRALEISEQNLENCPDEKKSKPKNQARAHYNVGIIHFVLGNHEKALEFLTTAYQIKSGGIYREAVNECRRAQNLAQKMVEVEEKTQISMQAAETAPPAARKARTVDPPPARANPSNGSDLDDLEAKLAKLKSLLEKGLITKEDYEQKKNDLLSAM